MTYLTGQRDGTFLFANLLNMRWVTRDSGLTCYLRWCLKAVTRQNMVNSDDFQCRMCVCVCAEKKIFSMSQSETGDFRSEGLKVSQAAYNVFSVRKHRKKLQEENENSLGRW